MSSIKRCVYVLNGWVVHIVQIQGFQSVFVSYANRKKMQLNVDLSPPANIMTFTSGLIHLTFDLDPRIVNGPLKQVKNFGLVNFGPVTDRQTDRKRCI